MVRQNLKDLKGIGTDAREAGPKVGFPKEEKTQTIKTTDARGAGPKVGLPKGI